MKQLLELILTLQLMHIKMVRWILISQSSHLCRNLIQRSCSTLPVAENSSHWCLVKFPTCKPHMDLSVTQWGPVRGDSACGVMFSGWVNNHREIGLTVARISPLLFSQHELYIRAYHMLSDFPEVSAWPTQTRTVNTHAHKHGSQVQEFHLSGSGFAHEQKQEVWTFLLSRRVMNLPAAASGLAHLMGSKQAVTLLLKLMKH